MDVACGFSQWKEMLVSIHEDSDVKFGRKA